MSYLYSIIIPHYNSPNLLKSMLESIPNRDDIQVVVVDDASSAENVKALKELTHTNLEFYFEKENLGAGHARNVGLSKARGQWLSFVDADDIYKPEAFKIFDQYKNENIDYLCYCIERFSTEGRQISDNVSNVSVKTYLNDPSEKNLMLFKYRNLVNWNKLVSMEFVKKNDIRFEECRVNNDIYFQLQLGLLATRFKVIPDVLYRAITANNSITKRHRDVEREFDFFIQAQKRNGFYKKLGLNRYPYYRSTWLYVPFILKKHGLKFTWSFFMMCYSRRDDIIQARHAYLPLFDKQNGSTVESKS